MTCEWNDLMTPTEIVRKLTKGFGVNYRNASEILGLKPQSYQNKCARRSFTFNDVIKIAYACGISLYFNCDNSNNVICLRMDKIYPEMKDARDNVKFQARDKYEALKNELEIMRDMYGFDE